LAFTASLLDAQLLKGLV